MSTTPSANQRLLRTLRHVIELLVNQQYNQLERITGGRRLKAEYIRAGVEDYGRTLILPPDSAFKNANIVAVEVDTEIAMYSVRFYLHTKEEGPSDLELQATMIDNDAESDFMNVEIDGILVA